MRYYITDKKKGKVLNRLSLAVLTGFLVFYIFLWHTFLQNPRFLSEDLLKKREDLFFCSRVHKKKNLRENVLSNTGK